LQATRSIVNPLFESTKKAAGLINSTRLNNYLAQNYRTMTSAAFGSTNLSAVAQAQTAMKSIIATVGSSSIAKQAPAYYHSELGMMLDNISQTRYERASVPWNQHQNDGKVVAQPPSFHRTKYHLVNPKLRQDPADFNPKSGNSTESQIQTNTKGNSVPHSRHHLSKIQMFDLFVGIISLMVDFGFKPQYIAEAVGHLFQQLYAYFATHS